MTHDELTRQTRRALTDLYDPAALRRNPLARTLADATSPDSPPPAPALRDLLVSSIESLKPGINVDLSSRPWLLYRVLLLRYVEARDPTSVQHELGLSKSQYYREHEAALESLCALLEQHLPIGEAGPKRGEAVRAEGPIQSSGVDASRKAQTGAVVLGGVGLALVIGLAIVLIRALAAPSASSVAANGGRSDRSIEEPPRGGSLPLYAGGGPPGHVNGAANLARFAGPFGLAVDEGGTVYVADTGNHIIRSITTTGLVLDVAGSGGEGFADGPRAQAQFSSPNAVTVGPDGTVYVADAGNLRIRAISPAGIVSTLAGSGEAGYLDGVGEAAQFAIMGAVVADPGGNIYTSDRLNGVVRRITPAGVVSTFAGALVRGHLDGPFQTAQFNVPTRMGADPLGNVYVLDTGDNRIRRMTPDGFVSTVAGGTEPGYADGPAAEAQFSGDILGITADARGAVYVMDAGNRRIRLIGPDGIVSTVFEVTDPNQTPGNIKLDRAGAIYLSDREHNAIYRLPPRGG